MIKIVVVYISNSTKYEWLCDNNNVCSIEYNNDLTTAHGLDEKILAQSIHYLSINIDDTFKVVGTVTQQQQLT
jgi:hypothetical protein